MSAWQLQEVMLRSQLCITVEANMSLKDAELAFPEFCEAECEAEDGLTIDDIQSESAGLATADCPQPLDTDFGGGNTTLMMTAYPVIGAHCTGLCTNLTAVLTGQLDTAQSDTLGNLCGEFLDCSGHA